MFTDMDDYDYTVAFYVALQCDILLLTREDDLVMQYVAQMCYVACTYYHI